MTRDNAKDVGNEDELVSEVQAKMDEIIAWMRQIKQTAIQQYGLSKEDVKSIIK